MRRARRGDPSRVGAWIALGLALCAACRSSLPHSVPGPELAMHEPMQDLAQRRAQAEEQYRARRYEAAREAFLTLAEEAAAAGDRAQRVEGLALAARMETLLGDLPAARARLGEALAQASANEPLGWSRCLLVRGIVEREGGQRDAARATWEEAYAYCRAHGLELRAVDAAHFVALLGDLESAIAWTEKALRSAEAAGDERWQAVLWNNLGWSFHDSGRHAEAHEALVNARRFHQRGGDVRAARIADWSVACAARLLGRLDEARALLEPVQAWAEERQRVEPGADSAEWLGLTLRELGELALAEGRADLALGHLERASALLSEAGMEQWAPADLAALERRIAELRAGP